MSVELTYNNTETPIQDVPSFIKVLYKNLNSKKKVKKKNNGKSCAVFEEFRNRLEGTKEKSKNLIKKKS